MGAHVILPQDLEKDRVLGTAQLAEFLGFSIPHVRRLYRAGKIPPPFKIGARKHGWRASDIVDLLASRIEEPR
jgi:predicted DNA-binding transcriptional regulator AlpA